ncbi:hypothetical protein CSKR_108333 [Clonorchis sinensis]|uniref:Uncharacterized protein n=1 Tax=Clonorchis sinensis TaxID=79923 RepID=A0A419PCA1_CLOSI|nr:hypothetical protein CSKR_108333 [Clonorchis sinensis]
MCCTRAASCFSWYDIQDIAEYFHKGSYSQVSKGVGYEDAVPGSASSHSLTAFGPTHKNVSGEWWSAQWLEREFTDRKIRGSNSTSPSQLPLSRLGQSGSTPAIVLPSSGRAVRR